jgi:hypothetical protein
MMRVHLVPQAAGKIPDMAEGLTVIRTRVACSAVRDLADSAIHALRIHRCNGPLG